MKIYTKTGDRGMSSLWGGSRVSKSSLRIDAYGTVDELNSIVGLIISHNPHEKILILLNTIQSDLMIVGSDLATPLSVNQNLKQLRVTKDKITYLEESIDELTVDLTELHNFILQGGSKTASFLHFARTVCRRAERVVTALSNEEEINTHVLAYLNRLSDWFFTAARWQNNSEGVVESKWLT